MAGAESAGLTGGEFMPTAIVKSLPPAPRDSVQEWLSQAGLSLPVASMLPSACTVAAEGPNPGTATDLLCSLLPAVALARGSPPGAFDRGTGFPLLSVRLIAAASAGETSSA